jgi:ABC-type transport system substrate-binding protein
MVLAAVVALTGGALAMRHVRSAGAARPPSPADTLIASIRAEPRSFNRYIARDLSTTVLTLLMHDALVRINRVTHQLEPDLAERWELLPDGRTVSIAPSIGRSILGRNPILGRRCRVLVSGYL